MWTEEDEGVVGLEGFEGADEDEGVESLEGAMGLRGYWA